MLRLKERYNRMMPLGNHNIQVWKRLSQVVGQNRNNGILGTEMIRIDQVQPQAGGLLKLMVFDIRGYIGITALFPSVNKAVRTGAAHDRKMLYRSAGVIVTQSGRL